jgi:hypothetical protein
MLDIAEQGSWALGGCCMDEGKPLWRCTSCRIEWGTLFDPNDPSCLEHAEVLAWIEKHYRPLSDEAILAKWEAKKHEKERARQAKLQSKLQELRSSKRAIQSSIKTSWWRKLFGCRTTRCAYGLYPDNPVLSGGLREGSIDYLERLCCPAGMPVRFEWLGSVKRTCVDYLGRPDVRLHVPTRQRHRCGADHHLLPLDAFLVGCGCGAHQEQLVFLDTYFRAPELAIGLDGWTLSPRLSPAALPAKTAPCPYCGEELRTPQAKQCFCCSMDWHDPDKVRGLESGSRDRMD